MRTVPTLAATLFVLLPHAASADDPSPCQPERWAEAIEAFHAADQAAQPPADATLFVGSSSIRLWDLEKWFPERAAINRGFGGSEICDSIHLFDELVARYRPATVVFYAGDNDIARGKTAEQVHRDFSIFVTKLQDALPETRLLYIAIKPSIARWNLANVMREANQQIARDCSQDKQLYFVDVWQPMLGDDGEPRPELFVDDGLHMNDQGYRLWTRLVHEALAASDAKAASASDR